MEKNITTPVVLPPAASKDETCYAVVVQEKTTYEGLARINAVAGTDVVAVVLQELSFLKMHMIAKPFIADCIPETVIQAVKYSLKNNLSLDPNAGLVYLTPTSVKVNGQYKNALEIKPTADGRLSIAYQCGTILDNKRPVITKNAAGKVTGVSVEILLPSVPSPRWETVEMDESDFERLKKFSHIKNARTWKQESGKPAPNLNTLNFANPLYSSFNGGMDPEFARSKVVSVSLKKRGTNQAARLSDRIVIVPEPKEVVVSEEKKSESEFTAFEEVKADPLPFKEEADATAKPPVAPKPKAETVAKVETAKPPVVETAKVIPTSLFPDVNDL